jgi:lysine 2,3-aminomutase
MFSMPTHSSREAVDDMRSPENKTKPPVPIDELDHKSLISGEFWKKLQPYAHVDESLFLDHSWQARNSITNIEKLQAALSGLVSSEFLDDAKRGLQQSSMSMRISPYLISLIDWDNPYADPLRRQFIPVASSLLRDHPKLTMDPLSELVDSPVLGLTHRYADKALFLALDSCPVYCRFCTRSYSVGNDTRTVDKIQLHVNTERWNRAFSYIESRPELEDIVVSGGDVYQLKPAQITAIGDRLLDMKHVRRIRFATKGPAVMPQKVLTDLPWRDALTRIVDKGRKLRKEVALHTHFNHPNEITAITEEAMGQLMERGVTIRNQSVLLRGVNDSTTTMISLIKRLSYINVHPYYIYLHDLVKGLEDLRTPLDAALRITKELRGVTAGFNTPTFVVDAPGGGGKRDVHTFEFYDRDTGISVFTSPAVTAGAHHLYFDPLHSLSPEVRQRWENPKEQEIMINDALSKARISSLRSRAEKQRRFPPGGPTTPGDVLVRGDHSTDPKLWR